MSSIGEGREGGGVGGVSTFWDPPSRILLGHFPEIIIIYLESSARELSIGTLFEQIGLREGGLGHVQKSEAQALQCRPWVSQAKGALIHSKLPG